jgi:hypothetical protein
VQWSKGNEGVKYEINLKEGVKYGKKLKEGVKYEIVIRRRSEV